MLLCLYIDSFFKKLTFITMFLLTVLVLGAKNLQKLPNRYRHLRLSFATYNSDWSKVSDVSEPLRNTWALTQFLKVLPDIFSSRKQELLKRISSRCDRSYKTGCALWRQAPFRSVKSLSDRK